MKKSLSDFYEQLKTIGLPVTYETWEKGNVPDLPYIIYYQNGKNPWYADNKPYYLRNIVTVELYTNYKDEKLEASIEAFFNAQDITLSSINETFWTDEHLYEVAYEFEI